MRLLQTLIALAILAALSALVAGEDAPTPQELCDAAQPAPLTMMQFEAAEQALEPNVDYRAIFCTSAGSIYVDLYESLTPITVNNFVFLARQGYYDSTTFHRVIPEFMAQGGDPTGSGRGGPGYQFKDEPVGFLTFDRPGLLAMANAGPGANGSQFFITTVPTPHLTYKHTIFGEVLVGQAVVEAIRERDPAAATEPGETLYTLLIISDPSAVDNSGVVDLAPATQAQVVSALEAFASNMPPSLPTNEERSGFFSTEQVAESVSTDLRDEYADYTENYGHQYRYRVELENAACDAAIYFTSLGYQVDVFESGLAAATALSDDVTRRVLESSGYAKDVNIYIRDLPTCSGEAGIQALSIYPIGRFLVSLDLLVASRLLEQAGVSIQMALADLSRQIESGFAAIYRPEIP
jgi:cyclophilin family peptidyl-prolyl cis-trans isomerase